MAARFHVVLRGAVYHFRRGVPEDLRPRVQRRELVRSLETSNARTARLRACELYIASEQLFCAVRATPMLTDANLASLVRDFYKQMLEGESHGRFRHGAITSDIRQRRADQYGMMAARARDALACNRLDEAAFVAREMLLKQGVELSSLDPAELAKAKQAILRAGIDVAETIKARYEGNFNYEPRDSLLKAQLETHPVVPTPSSADTAGPPPTAEAQASEYLSAVGTAFRASQIAIGAWDRQTSGQASATFRLFIDVCGDRPLAAYTRKDAGRFRERIETLPNDYGKNARYRDLTVENILTVYQALPMTQRAPLIMQKTVKRHFSALSTLWSAAVAKDEAATNIFLGFRFAGGRKASEQRDMWERADLQRLFASPVWTGSLTKTRRAMPGTLILRDEKFWLPLIAVFSGMRQEEICQLHVEDIRHDEGIWFLDINDRPPRKVKNATAVRRVPVHSELIRLGFLAHVDKQRRCRQLRVFPHFQPGGADARLGHAFTKWFTRYRRDVGLYRVGLDFHSFRHTATTLMHQAGVAPTVIDHVTGHATPGETARYTKRSTLLQLRDAIETIDLSITLPSTPTKAR